MARARLSRSDLVLREGFKQERPVRCVFRSGGHGSGHSQQRHGGTIAEGRFGTVSSHPLAWRVVRG